MKKLAAKAKLRPPAAIAESTAMVNYDLGFSGNVSRSVALQRGAGDDRHGLAARQLTFAADCYRMFEGVPTKLLNCLVLLIGIEPMTSFNGVGHDGI